VIERIEHEAEVLRQGAAAHTSTGKRDHRRTIGGLIDQGTHQALRRLDRHGHATGHGVLGSHAPADVHQEDHVVARRRRVPESSPARLCQGDDQEGDRSQPPQAAVARRTASLRQRLPTPAPLDAAPDRPEDQNRQQRQQPEAFRVREVHDLAARSAFRSVAEGVWNLYQSVE
jgi:hypothetical protein